ncbi:hypothetical protein [Flavobacterium selenitireducens]|uniref:hypothetical protein n=1 Tax=Flavobacterium selenitireducens TaxID=2722704 RepID=UPI00168B97A3|nr:hypothetical protein [Flavobacterium selenitireducens]MBD3582192.1 hypothetical protein [Flavobacterium selenitireducens]
MKRIYFFFPILLMAMLTLACNNRNENDENAKNNESELGTQIDEQSKGQRDSTTHINPNVIDTTAPATEGNAVEASQRNDPKATPATKE